jgi:peptidoglycan/xylan/chitin deacetylase (PgdA/CDA1 family)
VRGWVCLAYHDVTLTSPALSGGRDFFSVSAIGFERHLSIIRQLGARGCSIADALVAPSNAIAISFDDGDLGQAVRAFPALAKHNMTATFFVVTSWVGTANYASWDQLREMRAAGMSIQSHTHTHPFLSELNAAALRDELRRSRDILDEKLGQRTSMIAFPGGDAPRGELRALLAEEGYEVVATSRWGRNSPDTARAPRYIRRCTVRGNPSDSSFAAVARGDSWLNLRKQTRERVLAIVRAAMGPTRYARWRRSVMDAVGPG